MRTITSSALNARISRRCAKQLTTYLKTSTPLRNRGKMKSWHFWTFWLKGMSILHLRRVCRKRTEHIFNFHDKHPSGHPAEPYSEKPKLTAKHKDKQIKEKTIPLRCSRKTEIIGTSQTEPSVNVCLKRGCLAPDRSSETCFPKWRGICWNWKAVQLFVFQYRFLKSPGNTCVICTVDLNINLSSDYGTCGNGKFWPIWLIGGTRPNRKQPNCKLINLVEVVVILDNITTMNDWHLQLVTNCVLFPLETDDTIEMVH